MGESAMKCNMGSIDRGMRIVAGIALVSLVFIGPRAPWGWIGLIPIATGALGFCPLYTLVGIKTCPAGKK